MIRVIVFDDLAIYMLPDGKLNLVKRGGGVFTDTPVNVASRLFTRYLAGDGVELIFHGDITPDLIEKKFKEHQTLHSFLAMLRKPAAAQWVPFNSCLEKVVAGSTPVRSIHALDEVGTIEPFAAGTVPRRILCNFPGGTVAWDAAELEVLV